jgi:hypothetical protein
MAQMANLQCRLKAGGSPESPSAVSQERTCQDKPASSTRKLDALSNASIGGCLPVSPTWIGLTQEKMREG